MVGDLCGDNPWQVRLFNELGGVYNWSDDTDRDGLQDQLRQDMYPPNPPRSARSESFAYGTRCSTRSLHHESVPGPTNAMTGPAIITGTNNRQACRRNDESSRTHTLASPYLYEHRLPPQAISRMGVYLFLAGVNAVSPTSPSTPSLHVAHT